MNTDEENTRHKHTDTSTERHTDTVLVHEVKAAFVRSDSRTQLHQRNSPQAVSGQRDDADASSSPRTGYKRALNSPAEPAAGCAAFLTKLLLTSAKNRLGIAGRRIFSFHPSKRWLT